jgi:VRR-NUC domain
MTARQLLRAQITEAAWLDQVRQLARINGWLAYHTHDSRRSDAGFPDLVLVRPPELIVAELKTERGRVTGAQSHWIEALLASGVEALVWRPSDLEAVAARLARR